MVLKVHDCREASVGQTEIHVTPASDGVGQEHALVKVANSEIRAQTVAKSL